MRLSLFRQKSNTAGSNPSPTSQKKSNRLSSMFSSPARTRSETFEQPPLFSSPQTTVNEWPATASSPFNPPPMAATHTPPSTHAPPPPNPFTQQISSDGPPLPTSPPDHSFQTSSAAGLFQPSDNLDGSSEERDDPHTALPYRSHTTASRPKTTSSAEMPKDFSSSTLQSRQWGSLNQRAQRAWAPVTNRGPSDSVIIEGRYQTARTLSSGQSPNIVPSPTERLETPATRFRTTTRPQYSYPEEDQMSFGDDSFNRSSLQHRLSSPSAAAAQRSKLRAGASGARSAGGTNPGLDSPKIERIPSKRRALTDTSEPTRVSSAHLVSEPGSGGNHSGSDKPTSLDKAPNLASGRPPYLQKHQSSQRSSAQSFQSRESEATIGAEDLTTSGFATPGRDLTRLPSFGSIGSSASGGTEAVTPRGHKRARSSTLQLTTRGNLERVSEGMDDKVGSDQTTPRAKTLQSRDPTETVLARHVRNVEVPPTVARQYRSSHPLDSSDNSFLAPSSPFQPRGKNSLSLKDQNAKIDKLTKENFDLKLKIHFLYQALQDRSDEGVKDMISKNAQLQADLVQVKKENQSLRKRLRQLERGHEGASSVAPSHLDSEDGGRSVMTAQIEEEMSFLQQRMQDLEVENAQLSTDGQYQQLRTRLDHEVARRERAERKVLEMQQELSRLNGTNSPKPHLRIMTSDGELARNVRSRSSDPRETIIDKRDQDSPLGSTLVELEHLQQENNGLQQQLGAQASMLTSRNRERERLQQEIEDLKIVQRRGDTLGPGSAAGDSILDRSVSRAQNRSASQASGSERDSQLSDQERDRYETTQSGLRDQNALLKMQLQDLERELNSLGAGSEHIRALQSERDETHQALNEADADIDQLNDTIEQLDDMILLREDEIRQLKDSLRRREKESDNFRAEIDAINESFNLLVEDREGSEATIQSLQEDLANANGELEAMETKLRDVATAKERLEVQQESSQNEIAFLREEQEGDMIKLSELQSALAAVNSPSRSNGEAARDFIEMQAAASQARAEARQLRKRLAQRETEIHMLQDKLDDATGTLEEAVGNFDGTKASYSEDISRLQHDLEQLEQEYELARRRMTEKDRMLAKREALLETSSHETRRLNDLLDKERQGRKHDRNEVDRALTRAKGTPEAKVIAMERSRKSEKKRLAELEASLEERVWEREGLLFTLWNRVASICNSEGLLEHQQALAAGGEDAAANFTALSTRIPPVLDAIATHISSFPRKLDDTERSLTTDFTALSAALGQRTARLESLEQKLANLSSHGVLSGPLRQKYDAAKNENRLLRREIKFLKQGSFALPGLPSPVEDTDRPNDGDVPSPSSQPPRYFVQPPAGLADIDSETSDALSPVVHHGPHSKETTKNRFSSAGEISLSPTRNESVGDEHLAPLSYRKRGLHRRATDKPTTGLHSASATSLHASPNPNVDGASDVASSTGSASHQPQPQTNGIVSTSHAQSDESSPDGEQDPSRAQQPLTSASSLANLTIKPSDRTWAMRLDEMKKRMKMEREGRLLDRQSARSRLQEAESEKVVLKEELERERSRTARDDLGSVGSAATEIGPGRAASETDRDLRL